MDNIFLKFLSRSQKEIILFKFIEPFSALDCLPAIFKFIEPFLEEYRPVFYSRKTVV